MDTPLCMHPDLLHRIDACCEARLISRSAFGEQALGDPRFVFDLADGRELRRKTIERVEDFIRTGRTWAELKAIAEDAA